MRLRWLAFTPFAVVGIVQLTTKLTHDTTLDATTKALCVPLLALGALVVLVAARRRIPVIVTLLLGVGLLCSWLGDVLLDASLVLGLGSFLIAHLAFIGMFLVAFRRRMSWWTLLAVPWYLVLVVVLVPRLGGYLVPVLLYGIVLGGMAATATRGGVLTTLGGILWVVSDTLLALRLFTPLLQDDVSDLLVMLTYLAAVALLVLGMLARLVAWPTPSSSGFAPAISRTPRSRASRSPG